jgi:hypothetical protein
MDPPHSTKRSAEDAEFAELARMVTEEQNLTKQINTVDHELEILEMRRQTFMEKWEKDHTAVMEKRARIYQERSDVRKQFKRQRLSSAADES